jgi:wyosine [tRNA(Phe)-imidazoG37] synthetase (radical SAM superfamily)
MQVDRREFYKIGDIVLDVKEKVEKAKQKKETIDYLTFVPDGEPTLDFNLGNEIDLLKPLGIKIAVLTNASLMWREDVRNDLLKADWVSLKIDALSEKIWQKLNRPHKFLKLGTILEGMSNFANTFKGTLATETMLIQGVNDDEEEIRKIADFLTELKPDEVYVAVPTRPSAEKWASPASEQIVNMAYQIFSEKLSKVEYLIGYEGNAFAFTGNVEDDLLSITAVHPMREEGVNEFLSKANSTWDVIEKLIEEGKLMETEYRGKKFYMRKLLGTTKRSMI